MRTSRLEAFSDGVLAIVITIMVLELAVPSGHEWSDLLALWPKVLSYLISFVYVGIYWNNHHHLFQLVERVNGAVLWANLNLLLWLSLFPFVTGWAGESHFASVPMTCYAAVALMAAVSYTVLQQVAVRAHESNARAARAAAPTSRGWCPSACTWRRSSPRSSGRQVPWSPAWASPGSRCCGSCRTGGSSGCSRPTYDPWASHMTGPPVVVHWFVRGVAVAGSQP